MADDVGVARTKMKAVLVKKWARSDNGGSDTYAEDATIRLQDKDLFLHLEGVLGGTTYVRRRRAQMGSLAGAQVEQRARAQPSASAHASSPKKREVYWCSYGPEDNRQGPATLAELEAAGVQRCGVVMRGLSVKCNCQAHFTFRPADEDDLLIVRRYTKGGQHLDEHGAICHGPDAPNTVLPVHRMPRTASASALALAEELLREGVPAKLVLERVIEEASKPGAQVDGGFNARDALLEDKWIQNLKSKVERAVYAYDDDVAKSLDTALKGPYADAVVHYQPLEWRKPQAEAAQQLRQQRDAGGPAAAVKAPKRMEEVTVVKPFQLCVATARGREALLTHAHGGPVIMDTTFGTNVHGVRRQQRGSSAAALVFACAAQAGLGWPLFARRCRRRPPPALPLPLSHAPPRPAPLRPALPPRRSST